MRSIKTLQSAEAVKRRGVDAHKLSGAAAAAAGMRRAGGGRQRWQCVKIKFGIIGADNVECNPHHQTSLETSRFNFYMNFVVVCEGVSH
jgi:hypothetical protein